MDGLRCIASGAGRAARPLALLALLLATGCGGGAGAGAPPRLVDGADPPPTPRALEELEGRVVMTRERIVRAGELDRPLLGACLHRLRPVFLARGERLVERTGVLGASLTFRGRPRGWIRGCDASAGPAESSGQWCGVAAGRLRPNDGLYDSRLSIGCLDAEGRQIGLAWIEPKAGARYLSVEQPGYAEIYETAGGLPVRLATKDVHIEGSSATFRVRQYAADGKEIANETLQAVVAG